MPSSFGIDRILKLLPHRYPFLLVDRVLEASDDGTHLVAIKNVTMNEPFFQGHFPGNPIMPGVLHIEAMAQTAGLMCLSALEGDRSVEAPDGYDTILMGVDGAKFRRMIRPGDQMRIETTLISSKGRIGRARGVITVDGKVATECTMMFMFAPRKADK